MLLVGERIEYMRSLHFQLNFAVNLKLKRKKAKKKEKRKKSSTDIRTTTQMPNTVYITKETDE